MHRRLIEFFSYTVLLVTSFFCAGQVPPSGGPPDKTPPEVVSTYPMPGATNFHEKKIKIEFSKYVDPQKMQQSVFVSPNLGMLSYDWGGKGVEIQFNDSLLRPNTTYIFTLGTDVEDTRGNKLAQAFALPFATGDHIDSASIAGRVVGEKPVGVMIFAFLLDNRRPDSLNPMKTKPDYLSQTGKNGGFKLTNLIPGNYRLFAVRDEYKNFLYDPQIDQYGTAAADVHLTAATAAMAGIQFSMTSEDTTKPFLSSARASDRSHVLLRFSEAIDTAGFGIGSVTIADTLSGTKLVVLDASLSETLLEGHLVTSPQESARVYKVSLRDIRDRHENPMNDSLGSPFFDASIVRDTLKPTMKFLNGQDSVRNVDPEDSLMISFDEPVKRVSLEGGFSLFDSTRRKIDARFVWAGSMRCAFLPATSLSYGSWYRVAFRLDSVVDYAGNRGKDTLVVRRFQTIDEALLGSITGTIVDEDENGRGKVYLLATDVSEKSSKIHRAVLDSPGPFAIEHLTEGTYTLRAFRDSDGNGTYSFGSVFPYTSSERFTVYPDTLKVRARWPLEGVNLQLKRY